MRMPESNSVESLNDALPSQSIMVLLVDDQIMIGEAIRRLLMDQINIDFHYCGNSAEATAVAKQVSPTVILQDLVMPGVDGLTLVRQYRADPLTKDIPVVVLSTNDDPVMKQDAFTSGANDYLVKLPDKVELIARIRYHAKAYMTQIQRDEAYRALRESQKQLMDKNIELQRLTNVDGLTGLSNRRYFDEYIEIEWRRAIREKTEISLLLIDVDDFKLYNDTNGHLAGDEALKKVANTIRTNALRVTDLPARYGGEEFALILPVTPIAGARHVGERLRRGIENLRISHIASGSDKHLTASIGAASMVPERTGSALQLIEAADRAMYEAKRRGKNLVVVKERE